MSSMSKYVSGREFITASASHGVALNSSSEAVSHRGFPQSGFYEPHQSLPETTPPWSSFDITFPFDVFFCVCVSCNPELQRKWFASTKHHRFQSSRMIPSNGVSQRILCNHSFWKRILARIRKGRRIPTELNTLATVWGIDLFMGCLLSILSRADFNNTFNVPLSPHTTQVPWLWKVAKLTQPLLSFLVIKYVLYSHRVCWPLISSILPDKMIVFALLYNWRASS